MVEVPWIIKPFTNKTFKSMFWNLEGKTKSNFPKNQKCTHLVPKQQHHNPALMAVSHLHQSIPSVLHNNFWSRSNSSPRIPSLEQPLQRLLRLHRLWPFLLLSATKNILFLPHNCFFFFIHHFMYVVIVAKLLSLSSILSVAQENMKKSSIGNVPCYF